MYLQLEADLFSLRQVCVINKGSWFEGVTQVAEVQAG